MVSDQELGSEEHVDDDAGELKDDTTYKAYDLVPILYLDDRDENKGQSILTECDVSTSVGIDWTVGHRGLCSTNRLHNKGNYVLKSLSTLCLTEVVKRAYTRTKYNGVLKAKFSTKLHGIGTR
jgi:hypothetical protein